MKAEFRNIRIKELTSGNAISSVTDSDKETYFPPPESQGGWRKLEGVEDIRRVGGMARIAYCMAHGGRWRDQQVIPEWFVNETAQPTHDVKGLKSFNRGIPATGLCG